MRSASAQMSVPEWRGPSKAARGIALATVLAALGAGCEGRTPGPQTSSETHFLSACDYGDRPCVAGLACLCGVCTAPCADTAACGGLAPNAACVPVASRAPESACPESPASDFCDVPCRSDQDCAGLSSSPLCDRGFCRSARAPGADAGSDGPVGPEGATGPDACAHGGVSADEVVLLGDSFIASGHQITSSLEQLERASGALGGADAYRDYASSGATAPLAGMPGGLMTQYTNALAAGPVKVVIMDGGGADILLGTCPSPPTADCAVIQDAVAAANALFSTMAADGVEHVIYFFYPDAADPNLKAKMDVLRPLIQDVCTSDQALSCHWLDLRPVFAGHESEYLLPDGLNPSTAGAEATAQAIAALMQRECVAQ